MKTIIISYSATGNNDSLASNVAKEIGADHVKITYPHGKITCTIIMKHLLNTIPKVKPSVEIMAKYDFVILCGPIWMGKIAAPLRAYLKHLKNKTHKYAFITLCGGATGSNKGLDSELEKRVGRKPEILKEYCIATLLPQNPKPVIKDTMAYRVNDSDLKKVTEAIAKEFKNNI